MVFHMKRSAKNTAALRFHCLLKIRFVFVFCFVLAYSLCEVGYAAYRIDPSDTLSRVFNQVETTYLSKKGLSFEGLLGRDPVSAARILGVGMLPQGYYATQSSRHKQRYFRLLDEIDVFLEQLAEIHRSDPSGVASVSHEQLWRIFEQAAGGRDNYWAFATYGVHPDRIRLPSVLDDETGGIHSRPSRSGYQQTRRTASALQDRNDLSGEAQFSRTGSSGTEQFSGNVYSGVPVSGLVAEYLFEGNARDTSGRGHHGIEEGGLTYVAGKIGKAAGFDGKNDGIRIADDRELEFGKGAFTISAWIYPKVRSRMMAILDHMIDTGCRKNTKERSFLLRIRDNRINLVMNGTGKLKYNHQYKTRNTMKANQWHFIAVRYDGASITIYHNQKKVLEARYSGGLFDSSAPWYIGARHCRQKDPQWFKGKIDNLRVYRRALSEAQIRTLLREGSGAVYDAAENTGARIQWMGAEILDITPEMHRELHLASGTGALVDRVNRGGGSEKAGLRKGDIITHINSASVAGVNELLEKSSNIAPGQLVRIRFIRDGQSYVTKTRLSDSPALSQSSGHRSGRDGGASGSDFLNAVNDALQTARDNNIESGLRNPDGVDDSTSDRTVQAAPGPQEGIATENRGRILTRQDDDAVNLLGERVEEPVHIDRQEQNEPQQMPSRNESQQSSVIYRGPMERGMQRFLATPSEWTSPPLKLHIVSGEVRPQPLKVSTKGRQWSWNLEGMGEGSAAEQFEYWRHKDDPKYGPGSVMFHFKPGRLAEDGTATGDFTFDITMRSPDSSEEIDKRGRGVWRVESDGYGFRVYFASWGGKEAPVCFYVEPVRTEE